MTMYSGGICFILMGLFYYIIDIKKVTKLKFVQEKNFQLHFNTKLII